VSESKAERPGLDGESIELSLDCALRMYRQMVRIRYFEEKVDYLYKTAQMPGLAHLYSGQEAVAVGVCEALEKTDYISSTHRGHGHCLAKGASVDRMFAELLGKKSGYCGGKGGSMHIADLDSGNLGADAIVGASAGVATGAAFTSKKLGLGRVAVAFFGEGALGQGLLYELMNMAALWKLPVLYVCENNMYTEYTHYTETTAGELKDRPLAFGIHTEQIDGQNVREVYRITKRVVQKMKSEEGPAFLICNTYRYYGHHVGDINRNYYRSKEEEETWKRERDPIKILGEWLVDVNNVSPETLSGIDKEVHEEIETGLELAKSAPYPDPSEVSTNVYAE